jgi:hypothetical protein
MSGRGDSSLTHHVGGRIGPFWSTMSKGTPTLETRSIPDREPAQAGLSSVGKSLVGRRWVFEIGYLVLVLAAATLIVSIVGRRSGWPIGQAFNNELILVQLYAAHFRHLDFFPVWSSSDGLGLGTPVLLFYQKAFFYVSGFILILFGGALKATLVVTIAIFLIVGAYGMRRALEMITDSRVLCTVGSVGFLFTNYVFTDWLARGDLPEFSAMMIVPWLLFWCLNLVKNRRVSLLLIPIMALLVDAHSAIGLISVFTVAVALATFLTVAGLRGLKVIAPRLLVSVGGAAVLLAPTLLAEVRFAQYYDPTTKVTHGAAISQDFQPLWSYFYDGTYRWLVNTASLDLQIDFAIWIPIAICLVGVVTYWIWARRRPDRTDVARYLDAPSVLFLLISVAIYLLLQLRGFLFVYRVLAPLEVIDYPYRMLTFIVPIGVILVVAIAHVFICRFPTSIVPKALAGLWLVSLIVLSPITATWTTTYPLLARLGRFPSTSVSAPPSSVDYQTYKGLFSFNGILYDEYLPKIFTPNGVELYDDSALYAKLHSHQDGAASLSDVPCTVLVPTKSPLESLQLRYTVTCEGPTRLALPITFNAYSTVFVANAKGELQKIPYFHSRTDPRIIIDVKSSKPEAVVVHLPTLWGILS